MATVVVEIGGAQAHLAAEPLRRVLNARTSPTSHAAPGPCRRCAAPRHCCERDEVEHAVAVHVGDCDRFDAGDIRRQGALAKLALTIVDEDAQPSCAVDDCGVGIAVAVDVRPGNRQAGHALEGVRDGEAAVAVVAQHRGGPSARRE